MEKEKIKRKPKGYWTYDKVEEEAKKYNTYTEFSSSNRVAWDIAKKNGWSDDIKKHITNIKKKDDRIIYSFEFSDKSVYVGLTKHGDIRYKQHTKWKKNSAVYKYIKETGLIPKFTKETDFLSEEDSVKMEEYVEDWYRQNGWKVLNIAKTGSLGGGFIKWTYDAVEEEAKKYNRRSDFLKGSSSAYTRASLQNWLDNVTKHMEQVVKPNGYWTYGKVEEEAKKYNTRLEFSKGSGSAYSIALKNNWIDDVTKHIPHIEKNPRGYWTYDTVKEEAKKYNTRLEFQKEASSAYRIARKSGWLDNLTKHMVQVMNPKGYWTYDKVEEEAKKYNTRLEFGKGSGSAYNTARKSGWIDDVTKHMVKVIKPNSKTVKIILNT